MSLDGNLEDLALGDILQIVSLSRKSGTLSLSSRGREGKIFFQNGQIISAASSLCPEKASDLQRGGVGSQERIIRDRIRQIVSSFLAWSDGTFSFNLCDPRGVGRDTFGSSALVLEEGLTFKELSVAEKGAEESRGASSAAREGDTPSSWFNLGAELLAELGEVDSGGQVEPPSSPAMHLLKGMLQEMNNPTLGGGVILLVLRFASEFMNRAVIFQVENDQIVGLGQFGIEPAKNASADERVRGIRIPTAEPSIFSDVLQKDQARKVLPGENSWDDYLLEQLGGGRPQEVFVGSVRSAGRIVALLYGDNLPESREIGVTEPLEIFLSQAGLAMEKAMLEQRLSGRNGKKE